jgi:hypothetical protein
MTPRYHLRGIDRIKTRAAAGLIVVAFEEAIAGHLRVCAPQGAAR